jgi:hypothetical protein
MALPHRNRRRHNKKSIPPPARQFHFASPVHNEIDPTALKCQPSCRWGGDYVMIISYGFAPSVAENAHAQAGQS